MGVEPLPDILDRIAVESPVKSVRRNRYAAWPGRYPATGTGDPPARARCRTRRAPRQRCGVTQNLDQRRLVNDRSTRGIDEPGRWLHGLQLGRSDQALRPLAQDEVDRQDVGARKSSSLETSRAPQACALSGVRFWLQAITSMPNASPIRATSEPMLPRPRTPSVLPWRLSPIVSCQPPGADVRFPMRPDARSQG